MLDLDSFMTLTQYSQSHRWPSRNQWRAWIDRNHPIAKRCVKRVGRSYMVDVTAFREYVARVGLEGEQKESDV